MKIDQTTYFNKYASDSLGKTNTKKVSSYDVNENGSEDIRDTVEFNSENSSVTYDKTRMSMNSIAVTELMNADKEIGNSVKSMVTDLLHRQGLTLEDLKNGKIDRITVDKQAQTEAQKLIGPGGDFSPDKVSDRIVDFAIAAFGGDKSKIETIKNAIDRGFGEARRAWGGELPSITNETYDLIQKKLDKWINEDNSGQANETAAAVTEESK